MKFLSFIGILLLTIISAAVVSAQTTFTNSTAINIADATDTSVGTGTPYPSAIPVSGLTGTVTDVNVRINSLTHTFPRDLGYLLVSPTGQTMVIQSDVAGETDAVNVTYTLDDQAAAGIPIPGPLVSGTYKPTSVAVSTTTPNDDIFPRIGNDPPPSDCVGTSVPCPQAAPAGTATLNATFGGINPNGNWKLYTVDAEVGDTGSITGGWSIIITTGTVTPPTATKAALFDFTGNGRTDFTVFDNFVGGQSIRWKVLGNPALGPNLAFIRKFDYGIGRDSTFPGGDDIVPNDYTGDKKVEAAVRRNSEGYYYVAQFPTGIQGVTLDTVARWGTSSDVDGGEGDYDGDGKADYTVVRRNADNSLTWYMLLSATNSFRAVPYGLLRANTNTQILRGADFNGDGRDEMVIAQYSSDTNSNNRPVTYYAGDAVAGTNVLIANWGNYATDYSITPADYTGDGKADLVVVRESSSPATWYVRDTATGALIATPFGISDPTFNTNDLPVRGDYDGDGKQDIAVWRPSNQVFYYINSSTGMATGQHWGDAPSDIPLGILGTF